MKKFTSQFLVLLVMLLVAPTLFVHAQQQLPGDTQQSPPGNYPNSDPGDGTTLFNPLGGSGGPSSLMALLKDILELVVQIGSIVVVIMLIYVGYLFVEAQGKPEKLKTAKAALLWTIVGALILLGAQALTDGVVATVEALGAGI